jgi:O-acetyl-ADP-ribose deacetylase (regulator of RNase III)
MDRVLFSAHLGDRTVEVVQGDLTLQEVDAIVNAANSSLAHGGGLAGAIVRRGGEEIQAESYRRAPVPVGGATVTGAGRLSCRYVIHAVGPVWGEGDEERKLRRAVRSALARAEELQLASVAIPAISTGVFGYPKAEGCGVIAEEVSAHLAAPAGSVRLIRLVAIDEETASHLSSAARAVW